MIDVFQANIKVKFALGSLQITATFIGLLSMMAVNAHAQKNDTVYLNNGDRLTGEFKKFEYGQLFLKTDAMQTIYIEFDKNELYRRSMFRLTEEEIIEHVLKETI